MDGSKTQDPRAGGGSAGSWGQEGVAAPQTSRDIKPTRVTRAWQAPDQTQVGGGWILAQGFLKLALPGSDIQAQGRGFKPLGCSLQG